MTPFRSIFGIDKNDIRKTCVLVPFLPAGVLKLLGVGKLETGTIFASASTDDLTLIRTGIGAGFVGDAVLWLGDSPCRDIIFLGSCGLIEPRPRLGLGHLVTPVTAYPMESFSDITTSSLKNPQAAHPDEELLREFIKKTKTNATPVTCVSFASLFHEENHIPFFKGLPADVIEMECAALFLAAKKVNKRALALLFIADILKQTPFHAPRSAEDKKNLAHGIKKACQAIRAFASVGSNEKAAKSVSSGPAAT